MLLRGKDNPAKSHRTCGVSNTGDGKRAEMRKVRKEVPIGAISQLESGLPPRPMTLRLAGNIQRDNASGMDLPTLGLKAG
ncbi:hypothetical protein GGQ68_001931 [Sagittula marina]|uniref:Uncharacterized protein n=1 Tax=Sagittula marina TaxID=943940 RepID=A0A7W6DMA2_9RHOB|nr:hypothetical protein [Sagittula marina]